MKIFGSEVAFPSLLSLEFIKNVPHYGLPNTLRLNPQYLTDSWLTWSDCFLHLSSSTRVPLPLHQAFRHSHRPPELDFELPICLKNTSTLPPVASRISSSPFSLPFLFSASSLHRTTRRLILHRAQEALIQEHISPGYLQPPDKGLRGCVCPGTLDDSGQKRVQWGRSLFSLHCAPSRRVVT